MCNSFKDTHRQLALTDTHASPEKLGEIERLLHIKGAVSKR